MFATETTNMQQNTTKQTLSVTNGKLFNMLKDDLRYTAAHFSNTYTFKEVAKLCIAGSFLLVLDMT